MKGMEAASTRLAQEEARIAWIADVLLDRIQWCIWADATREQAVEVIDGINEMTEFDDKAVAMVTVQRGITHQDAQDIIDAHFSACHRTASTAALTAEIQRLREKVTRLLGFVQAAYAYTRAPEEYRRRVGDYSGNPHDHLLTSALDSIARLCNHHWAGEPAALSTPSEVSEPVADHIGGEGLLPCPFCGGDAERITIEDEGDNFGGDVIQCMGVCGASSHVEFGRKENLVSLWNTRITATPPNTNGDAVREALGKSCSFTLGPSGVQLNFHSIQDRDAFVSAHIATLAKHGGGGSMKEPTLPERIDAVLAELRSRKLLRYIFSADPDDQGPYGYLDRPLELDVQREIAVALIACVGGTIGADAARQRAIMASVNLGAWMSAALDDPNVCEEMKADVREWFSAGEPVTGWTAHICSMEGRNER